MQSGSLWSGNHRRLFQYLVKRLTGGYFTQQQNSSTGRAEHNSLGSEILKGEVNPIFFIPPLGQNWAN